MTVIWTKNGIVENDPWSGDDSADRPKLLDLSQFLEHARDNEVLGVRLAPSDDVRQLEPHLDRIAMIAVSFPAFSDGRGFSQATLLRQRLGYTGEMRAVGQVLIDQVPHMLRSGFDSFEVEHGPTIDRLRQNRIPGIDQHYQPAPLPADRQGGYSWRRAAVTG
jgi:uncharacterized protein (DUF934 family)